ncbi:MAG TPA: hypothetical protein VFR35_08080 [Actinoplanes sp.]|nr:hypothetical protein [Actinoplanes sp.]
MRTIIVRLAEPEQTGGELRGVVEELGTGPVPFHGADALLRLLAAPGPGRPRPPAVGMPPTVDIDE